MEAEQLDLVGDTTTTTADDDPDKMLDFDDKLKLHHDDQIDIYADDPCETTANNNDTIKGYMKQENEEEVNEEDAVLVEESVDESGLYDDVMAAPTPSLSTSELYANTSGGGGENALTTHDDDDNNENNDSSSTTNNNKSTTVVSSSTYSSSTYTKRVSCYVGNLTWWTTDRDLSESIATLGIADLIEVKFFENKVNGQSKGFALVIVASDQSFRTLMDKLPKQQVNGQEPVVTPFTRTHFNQFEEQSRKDMPPPQPAPGLNSSGGSVQISSHYSHNNNNNNESMHHHNNDRHYNNYSQQNNQYHNNNNSNHYHNYQQQQQQQLQILQLASRNRDH